MHGVAINENIGTYRDWDDYVSWIEQAHPGQVTIALNAYNGWDSTKPMYTQVYDIYQLILTITNGNSTFDEGYHLIGHSQGALILRSIIEMFGLPVENFISLAGMHQGVYGYGDLSQQPYGNFTEYELTKIFYTETLQNLFSIANWWNDPTDQNGYILGNEFLPVINQQLPNPMVNMKSNFIKSIQGSLYAFGSPQDGTIVPWVTELFGFFDDKFNLLNMTETPIYINDTFGLKTLDQQQKLFIYELPDIKHTQWLTNQEIFENYILDVLT
ncbi:palmitoyl-protein thioesterase 2 [Tieghemostelium lacteum]|uniref:Palmitoyl-protein thioesterase 2 n=1 Tax=Tieghemostelium lacteum TaxID=361077 RepID=A0A151ZHL7_TIELA|nr:palmitoyl-protein thioesterase 2 [Tieghemostelium lacteum]|eukprot:KYQ93472.1 palmitoyl-protein thioesterase 2 [Tieghemostelium lacteum]